MLHRTSPALLLSTLTLATTASATGIIAQNSGLANPQHVIDFGANLYPNLTPITNQFPPVLITHARYYTTGTSNNLVGGFITNDFSGSPDTLTIKWAAPISDLTFVYHQISTSGPSTFRAMLGGVLVESFSNLSNQTQPNNYFGFTGIVFDELQLDFVVDFNVDTLAFNDAQQGPTVYCTAGTTTNGCVPSISASGNPNVAHSAPCQITIAGVEGQKTGIVFYALAQLVQPWCTTGTGSSLLCVKPPTMRTGVQPSGGTNGLCDGALTLNWNAFQLANPSALGAPWSAGAKAYVQGWFRDPPACKTTSLSDAVELTYTP